MLHGMHARWLIAAGLWSVLAFGQGQNPSPMVEHRRTHPRLAEAPREGRRETLSLGRLFIPGKLAGRKRLPLVVHFHGGSLPAEIAAVRNRCAVIAVQLGSGSATYASPFADEAAFGRLLDEAGSKTGNEFTSVALTGWSAGYGAIRAILTAPEWYRRVERVLLIDGLHTGYAGGKPGPLEPQLEAEGLSIFAQFARDAVAGRKRMLITHSEIFPGTFASTTETADWLLAQLGLRAKSVLRWGPMGTQQLSAARAGRFELLGFAGNSAPDHVDQLHALPEFLKRLRER